MTRLDWRERVLSFGNDRASWLAARRGVLTASDVATVLGIGGGSKREVLRSKLSSDEVRPDIHTLPQVALGRHLESGVFEWFVEDTIHETASRCGALVQHPDVPWLAATPDALLDDEPVEIKVAMDSSRPNWHAETVRMRGWPERPVPVPLGVRSRFPFENLWPAKNEGPTLRATFLALMRDLRATVHAMGEPRAPLKYWVQLQVQMSCLGADAGWIVGLQAGSGRFDLYYERDTEFERWMLGECETFVMEARKDGWQPVGTSVSRSHENQRTGGSDGLQGSVSSTTPDP